MGTEEDVIVGTYTKAKDFQPVIANINDVRLPGGPWTRAQFTVTAGLMLFLLWTRSLWAHFGFLVNVLLAVGIPVFVGWLARAQKIEGRDPLGYFLGLFSLFTAPGRGIVQGKPWRSPRPRRLGGKAFYGNPGRWS